MLGMRMCIPTRLEVRMPNKPINISSNGFHIEWFSNYSDYWNPCLDFFFHVVPDTPPEELLERLQLSWRHNALTTLKLICNLRGVRGTGKSDKEGFYTASLWLHNHHPKTLACNIKAIADFGYFKDVLEILYRLLEGYGVRKNEKTEWMKKKQRGFLEGLKEKKDSTSIIPKGKAKIQREKTLAKAKKLLDRCTEDYDFQFLLRKEVLVPLHKALEIPEINICANKWEELPYKQVLSEATKMYKKLFYKHDKKRFEQYLEDVKSGKTTIPAGALLPHEIIASLDDSTGQGVAELQWERMGNDLAKKGKLTNCHAICDVSGSMSGTPMEVSVALGLLISEPSEEPWKGKLITFSHNPEFHIKVFDKILEVAVKGKLNEGQMIKRLFVFSDMEFDQASRTPWETDYQVIQRKFKEKGYYRVPEIVFWNLRILLMISHCKCVKVLEESYQSALSVQVYKLNFIARGNKLGMTAFYGEKAQ
ncbi:hypothetical protein RND71_014994 [Anisodus tanguticus]|uniref:Uncharacterized protein n=1 Tax=Anisodus tanguticus TaxID=243964 RepID=A0AAE1SCP0_9SOLA|nr:hypothetical protein RND71_014994 [Anisodus tanguticus]